MHILSFDYMYFDTMIKVFDLISSLLLRPQFYSNYLDLNTDWSNENCLLVSVFDIFCKIINDLPVCTLCINSVKVKTTPSFCDFKHPVWCLLGQIWWPSINSIQFFIFLNLLELCKIRTYTRVCLLPIENVWCWS